MTITQTVEIPADRRRLTIDVPREIPAGRTILTFTPAAVKKPTNHRFDSSPLPGGNARTVEEALKMAAEKAADPNRKPISRLFGTLSEHSFGDPVAYQRAIRDEWD